MLACLAMIVTRLYKQNYYLTEASKHLFFSIHKDIFACLFSIHNIISLSCHEQVSLLVHDMINLLYLFFRIPNNKNMLDAPLRCLKFSSSVEGFFNFNY